MPRSNLYKFIGLEVIFKGAVSPVCSTVPYCAAHCIEKMYVPVEKDKRTLAYCTRTFEKSVRTSANMYART